MGSYLVVSTVYYFNLNLLYSKALQIEVKTPMYVFAVPGVCLRTAILFKIEAFSKNKHSRMHDIGVSQVRLPASIVFENNEGLGQIAKTPKGPSRTGSRIDCTECIASNANRILGNGE